VVQKSKNFAPHTPRRRDLRPVSNLQRAFDAARISTERHAQLMELARSAGTAAKHP
jgi:hypothetical protein